MKRDTKIVLAFVAAIPTTILGAATLCAFAIANGASMRWRLLFRLLCHGIPERCLELFGVPMPVCARCTGIYAGLLAGIALFTSWRLAVGGWRKRFSGSTANRRPSTANRFGERVMRSVAFIAAVPLAIDGLTQLAGLRESTNPLRIATGLIAGLAFGLWILSAVERRDETIVTTS